MLRQLVHFVLLTVLSLASCSTLSTATSVATELPPLEGTWTIRMVHSGGIMGLSRSIEISSDGNYTAVDERNQQRIEGLLSKEELVDLNRQVASLNYSPNTRPYGCADCFVYDIEISGSGKPFMAQVDDVTIEESGLGPLVMILRTIMDRELN